MIIERNYFATVLLLVLRLRLLAVWFVIGLLVLIDTVFVSHERENNTNLKRVYSCWIRSVHNNERSRNLCFYPYSNLLYLRTRHEFGFTVTELPQARKDIMVASSLKKGCCTITPASLEWAIISSTLRCAHTHAHGHTFFGIVVLLGVLLFSFSFFNIRFTYS